MILGFLLDLGSLEGLLALKIHEHQLTKLHQLLDGLFGNLIPDFNRLHSAVGRCSHRPERGEHGLLALQLLPLETRRAERTQVVSSEVCDQTR